MVAYVREGTPLLSTRWTAWYATLVRELTGKRRPHPVSESLTFTAESSPMSQLLLNVMGSFAEFERALIRERKREGIAVAKACGFTRTADGHSRQSRWLS